MKKLYANVLLATALLMGVGALLASCSDSDKPGPGPDQDDTKTTFYSACTYKGDKYESQTGMYDLLLSTCKVDDKGNPTTAGEQYLIRLFSSVAANPDNASPAAGTYRFDPNSSHALHTIAAKGTKIWMYDKNIEKTAVAFADMTVTIEGEGAAMTVAAKYTFADGTTTTVEAKDFIFDSNISSGDEMYITDDVDLEGAAAACMWMGGGHKVNNETVSWYTIRIATASQTELLCLDVFGPPVDKFARATVPVGTFPVTTPALGTAQPGLLDEDIIAGCYYVNQNAAGLQPPLGLIESGNITVTKTGDEYSVAVDCMSTNGYIITGSYTGPMPLVNATGTSTLGEDREIDVKATTGDAYYVGEQEGTGLWQVISNQNNLAAGDQMLNMAFWAKSTTFSDDFPVGTYKTSSGKVEPDTFMPGSMSKTDGKYSPTTWIELKDSKTIGAISFIKKGTITVTKDASGTYTFTLDVYDDVDNHLTGSWTATLTIHDNTNKSASKHGAVKTMNVLLSNAFASSLPKVSGNRFPTVE